MSVSQDAGPWEMGDCFTAFCRQVYLRMKGRCPRRVILKNDCSTEAPGEAFKKHPYLPPRPAPTPVNGNRIFGGGVQARRCFKSSSGDFNVQRA